MPLNHATTFVSLYFEGLFVICFNKEKGAEVGRLVSPDHVPAIEIFRFKSPLPPTREVYEADWEQNLRVEVENSAARGVVRYEVPGFKRETDEGDPEDFRWVCDLEGKELHDVRLALKQEGRPLTPIVHIPSGAFYAKERGRNLQVRVTWEENSPWVFLGRVASTIGVDIPLDSAATAVVLASESPNVPAKRLEKEPGVKYRIRFKNNPVADTSPPAPGSHFRRFYDAFDVPETKYDFRLLEVEDDLVKMTQPPLRCDGVWLSRTETLS